MNIMISMLCPCESGKSYIDCCKPLHDGSYPDHALSLMRSRYSGYAYGLLTYIIRTTHPDNPNYQQDHAKWREDISNFYKNTSFEKLEILEFIDGEDEAFVTFHAHFSQNNSKKVLVEKSRFLKEGKQWLYREAVCIEWQ